MGHTHPRLKSDARYSTSMDWVAFDVDLAKLEPLDVRVAPRDGLSTSKTWASRGATN